MNAQGNTPPIGDSFSLWLERDTLETLKKCEQLEREIKGQRETVQRSAEEWFLNSEGSEPQRRPNPLLRNSAPSKETL